MQINSEHNYPELASDSTALKAQSRKTTLTSEASCREDQFPRLLKHLSDMATKLGIPKAFLLFQVTDDCLSLGWYKKITIRGVA